MERSRGCGCGCGEPERHVECCAMDCLEAPRFFCGQLLTDQHLNDLMTWTRAKNALARYRDGWGVACGLDIHCDETTPGGVVISPGYARSCCGDDIVVCEDARLDLSSACDQGLDPCEEFELRNKTNGENAKTVEPLAVDVFIAYREEQTHPEASLARTACGETGRCEYTRTQETYSLSAEPGGSGDPLSYAALRWREAYDEALEVIDAFRATFRDLDGGEAEAIRSWLLNWIDVHHPHHFCFLRERICAAGHDELTNEAVLSEHLFRIAQDRRNQLLTCPCFECGAAKHGVPLGRIWLDTDERRGACRIRAIDPFPPYRRPLSAECWPAPLGYVNAGQVIWHRRAEACVRLADLGVRIKEVVEFEPPPTLAELRDVLGCDPMVRCGDERTLLAYEMGPFGERVIGLCGTGTPAPQPPRVTVVKTGTPAEGVPGTFVEYEYAVTNRGEEPFDALVEDDQLGEVGNREVAPGATETFEASADVPSDAQGTFTNIVRVTATGPSGTATAQDTHDFKVTVPQGEPPSINLLLRAQSAVSRGLLVNYSLFARNEGSVDVKLKMSDSLSALPQEATDEIALAAGDEVSFRYSYRPLSGEKKVTEVVQGVGRSADGQEASDEDQVSTKISRQVEDPVPEERHRLQDIDGIADKRAQALQDGGIDSLEALLAANPDDVAQLLGPPTTADNARAWQKQAKELLAG